MPRIYLLDFAVLYQNPKPHVKSRHAYFPGLAELPSGELIALFVIGEAFESVDMATNISRSSDGGRTWNLQGPLFDKAAVPMTVSDTMKPLVLDDGTLIAMGYWFHRSNSEDGLGNPETEGIQPGDDIISFSKDEGRTWTVPQPIAKHYPELLELSGSPIQLRCGDILGSAAIMKQWDGTLPSGQLGVLLRSKDKGKTWSDNETFFEAPGRSFSPFESRLCEMQDGRIVSLDWAFNYETGENLENHYTVSHDNGHTWTQPISTGIKGQASGLMWLGGDMLLTIHSHRSGDVGLMVRIVDFSGDKWKTVCEKNILRSALPQSNTDGFAAQCASLRFGQPSLTKLKTGEIIATYWCVEDGLGRILTQKLAVEL